MSKEIKPRKRITEFLNKNRGVGYAIEYGVPIIIAVLYAIYKIMTTKEKVNVYIEFGKEFAQAFFFAGYITGNIFKVLKQNRNEDRSEVIKENTDGLIEEQRKVLAAQKELNSTQNELLNVQKQLNEANEKLIHTHKELTIMQKQAIDSAKELIDLQKENFKVTVDTIIGGNSFCEISLIAPSIEKPALYFYLRNWGDFPIYDMEARIVDITPGVIPTNKVVHFGMIPQNNFKQVNMDPDLKPKLSSDEELVWDIYITARNGQFRELLKYKLVEGKLAKAVLIIKDFMGPEVLYAEISSNYPEKNPAYVFQELNSMVPNLSHIEFRV